MVVISVGGLEPAVGLTLFVSMTDLFFTTYSSSSSGDVPMPRPSQVVAKVGIRGVSSIVACRKVVDLACSGGGQLAHVCDDSPLTTMGCACGRGSRIDCACSARGSPLMRVDASLRGNEDCMYGFSGQRGPMACSCSGRNCLGDYGGGKAMLRCG